MRMASSALYRPVASRWRWLDAFCAPPPPREGGAVNVIPHATLGHFHEKHFDFPPPPPPPLLVVWKCFQSIWWESRPRWMKIALRQRQILSLKSWNVRQNFFKFEFPVEMLFNEIYVLDCTWAAILVQFESFTEFISNLIELNLSGLWWFLAVLTFLKFEFILESLIFEIYILDCTLESILVQFECLIEFISNLIELKFELKLSGLRDFWEFWPI